jgi:regulator of replication initiation timing
MKQDIYGENQDLRIKVIRLEKENKKLQLDNKELKEKFSLYAVSHRRELLVCEHRWINNTHDNSKYCSRGCDGFIKHEAN